MLGAKQEPFEVSQGERPCGGACGPGTPARPCPLRTGTQGLSVGFAFLFTSQCQADASGNTGAQTGWRQHDCPGNSACV